MIAALDTGNDDDGAESTGLGEVVWERTLGPGSEVGDTARAPKVGVSGRGTVPRDGGEVGGLTLWAKVDDGEPELPLWNIGNSDSNLSWRW